MWLCTWSRWDQMKESLSIVDRYLLKIPIFHLRQPSTLILQKPKPRSLKANSSIFSGSLVLHHLHKNWILFLVIFRLRGRTISRFNNLAHWSYHKQLVLMWKVQKMRKLLISIVWNTHCRSSSCKSLKTKPT